VRERAVGALTGVEIGLDLIKSQVVELLSINGQRRNGRAGVAGDQSTAARFIECHREARPGVVDGLRRDLVRLDAPGHRREPAPHEILVHSTKWHVPERRKKPLAPMGLEVDERPAGEIRAAVLEQSRPERGEAPARP
jgi:hypothetical protein